MSKQRGTRWNPSCASYLIQTNRMHQQVILKGRKRRYYSPLRYPGGKTILFPFLLTKIEESGLRDVTYIEPFAGGAGAALALLFNEVVDRIVINDLDKA